MIRGPYLAVVVAFALAVAAALPIAQTSAAPQSSVAVAAGGAVLGALIVMAIVVTLSRRVDRLTAEVTEMTGQLEGERRGHTDTRADAELRLRVAQEQRRLLDERFASVVRAIPGALVWYDRNAVVTAASGAALLTIYPGDSIVGKSVQDLKARNPSAEGNIRRALTGEEFTAIEQLPELRIETRYVPLHEGDTLSGVLAVSLDLRERDRLEQTLLESDERARRLFDELPIPAAFVGADDRILLANRSFSDALGLDAKRLASTTLRALTHPDDAAADGARERLLAGEVRVHHAPRRLLRKDGVALAYDASFTVVRDAQSRPLYQIVMLKEASGRAHDEQVAAHYARHDPTTELPNRVAFEERLEQTLAAIGAEKQRLGLVAFDVVNLAAIAQRLGRPAADAVLRELARRARGPLSEADTLARIGRGLFALAVARRGAAGTAEVVEKLLAAVADGFSLDGQRIHPDLRLGFAMFPEDAGDAEQLLRRAELALHHAKRNDRRYVRFAENVLV